MNDWLVRLKQQLPSHGALLDGVIATVVGGLILAMIVALTKSLYSKVAGRRLNNANPAVKLSLVTDAPHLGRDGSLVPNLHVITASNTGGVPTSVNAIKVREDGREQPILVGVSDVLEPNGKSKVYKVFEESEYWDWRNGRCYFDLYVSHRSQPYSVRIPSLNETR